MCLYYIYSLPAFTCLKSTMKTPEQCEQLLKFTFSRYPFLRKTYLRYCYVVFIVNFEQISHPVLVFQLLTLSK